MSRDTARIALVMEMNLLLAPVSLAIACSLTALVVLGIPHSIELVATRHDLPGLGRLASLVLALFPVYSSWTLGVMTVRRELYQFDADFWIALGCSLLSVDLAMRSFSPLAIFAMLPVWLFTAHMALLQLRLRRNLAAPGTAGSP